jgi:hypothetical protein
MLALIPQNPQTIPYDSSYFFGWSFLVKSVPHPTEPANYRGSYTTGLIEIVVIEITMYRAAGTISTTAIELLLVKLMLIRTTPLGQISTIALSRILRILI